jgi:glucokinase
MSTSVLAGDVGGTKTLLRLVGSDGESLLQARHVSAEYEHLTTIVEHFLEEARKAGHARPRFAAFGVAGPVVNGVSKTTNLPWHLEEGAIASALRLERVRLMNDFEATAYGVVDLPASSLSSLQDGANAGGTLAVIGAGTGLGEAIVVPTHGVNGNGWLVVPSEGGHADFAPHTDLEIDLFRYLRERHDHVSWERVASGIGIGNCYEFLRDANVVPESPAIAAQFDDNNRNSIIGREAVAGTDPLCMQAVQLFLGLYGAEAGNLALKALATGGVYLTGGIAPKLLPLMKNSPFLSRFRSKGRLSSVVERVPVHVVLDQEVPLRGAAYVAQRM